MNHCTVPGCDSAAITVTIPVTVAVQDGGGNPQAGLPVYVFDYTIYTGFHRTTNGGGEVTFTLPMGDYRFRADVDDRQYWSGESNHCSVPGCTSATVTVPATPGEIVSTTIIYVYPDKIIRGERRSTQSPDCGGLLLGRVLQLHASTTLALIGSLRSAQALRRRRQPPDARDPRGNEHLCLRRR